MSLFKSELERLVPKFNPGVEAKGSDPRESFMWTEYGQNMDII